MKEGRGGRGRENKMVRGNLPGLIIESLDSSFPPVISGRKHWGSYGSRLMSKEGKKITSLSCCLIPLDPEMGLQTAVCVLWMLLVLLQSPASLRNGPGEGCGRGEEGARGGGDSPSVNIVQSFNLSAWCQCFGQDWSLPCGPHVTSNLTLCFQGMAF